MNQREDGSDTVWSGTTWQGFPGCLMCLSPVCCSNWQWDITHRRIDLTRTPGHGMMRSLRVHYHAFSRIERCTRTVDKARNWRKYSDVDPLLARWVLWRQHGDHRPAQSHRDPLPPLDAPALCKQRHGESSGSLLSCQGDCSLVPGLSSLLWLGRCLTWSQACHNGVQKPGLDIWIHLLSCCTLQQVAEQLLVPVRVLEVVLCGTCDCRSPSAATMLSIQTSS